MRTTITKLAAPAWGVTILLCLVVAATPGAALETTGHNLLVDPPKTMPADAQSREVCAFCHFPQGAEDSTPREPTWSRNGNGSSKSFQTFATYGIAAPTTEPEGTAGGVSMACLSCHDGTHAPSVGVDSISGSHPIGMPYSGYEGLLQTTSGRYYQGSERDYVNQVPIHWVETGRLGRQKSDMQLYVREDWSTGREVPYVECSTCHDPHSSEPLLLRVQNTNSQLCMACHLK